MSHSVVELPASAALACHPSRAETAVSRIEVNVTRDKAGALHLAYRVNCPELSRLRIPTPAQALPPERLWAYTCCELFVAEEGADAYREFNFSPNGQWMRFDFSGYRQRVASPAGPAPRLRFQPGAEGFVLNVVVPAAQLPAGHLRVGLTAVLENADSQHSYWALHHPCAQPDFHHREGFALLLKA